MKRILAMLMSAIFAMINNVGYVASGPSNFTSDSYYMFEDQSAMTPRQLYNGDSQNSERTIVDPFEAPLKTEPQQGTNGAKSTGHYWIAGIGATAAPDYEKITSYGDKYTFDTDDIFVICPQAAKIITKPNGTGGGHNLTLQTSDGYIFTIEKMERLYCDTYRTHQDNWTGSPNLEGITVPAGFVIGSAKAGETTFTISKGTGNGKGRIQLVNYYYTGGNVTGTE